MIISKSFSVSSLHISFNEHTRMYVSFRALVNSSSHVRPEVVSLEWQYQYTIDCFLCLFKKHSFCYLLQEVLYERREMFGPIMMTDALMNLLRVESSPIDRCFGF